MATNEHAGERPGAGRDEHGEDAPSSSSAAADRRPRTLGWFESYAATVPGCVIVMAAHLRGGGGRLDPSALRPAVEATCLRHPNLRSVLTGKGGGDGGGGEDAKKEPSLFRLLSDFRVRPDQVVVVDEGGEDWEAVADRESNSAFDLEGNVPYWKVVLVRGDGRDVLLVKYHHFIGDGSSGLILVNDILRFHEEFRSNGAIDEGSLNVLPRLPSADVMSFPRGLGEEENKRVDRAAEELRSKRESWTPTMRFSPDPPPGNRHSFLVRDGTEGALARLSGRCRASGATVGSVLAAAMSFAVARMYGSFGDGGEEDGGDEFRWDLDVDVNLRKRLPVPLGDDHVGAFVGGMSFNLAMRPSTTFWGFAKEVRVEIANGLEEERHLFYAEVNRRLDVLLEEEEERRRGENPFDPAAAQTLKGRRRVDWDDLSSEERNAALALGHDKRSWNRHGHENDIDFSSIGKYPFPTEVGSLSVEKVYCLGGGWCPMFGAYVFLISSTKFLNFSLVYESSELNDKVANEFFDLAVNLAEKASDLTESFTLADFLLSKW